MDPEEPAWLTKQKKAQKKELKAVDHSKMEYAPFRKDFYLQAPEITAMTDEEVKEFRAKEMGEVKIRGM